MPHYPRRYSRADIRDGRKISRATMKFLSRPENLPLVLRGWGFIDYVKAAFAKMSPISFERTGNMRRLCADYVKRKVKQRRRRQRERHRKAIGLMSKNNRSAHALNILVHLFAVLCKQREMTKFKVLWRTRAHDGEFLILLPYLNAVPINLVPGYFANIVQVEWVRINAK